MGKILLADDSTTARLLVQRCFEMMGISGDVFLHAANGEEALQILRSTDVDLLITDMVMPALDGRELLRCVKASPKLHALPVFVVTSLANEALESELLALGAAGVICKPVSLPKLQVCFETFGREA